VTFQVKTVALPPGGARSYDSAEWRDALVLVASGSLELEFTGGARRRFSTGAMLWLARLSLRALHNPGSEVAVLVAVSRRPMSFEARPVCMFDGFERRR
jgi:quercetin dioxygenase-like cupin family protein